MPDRVLSAAKIGSDKVVELLKAITTGDSAPPTEEEWASLRDFWQGNEQRAHDLSGGPETSASKLIKRRRGQHKSRERYIQGANRRFLRDAMKGLKIKLRNDPAELQLKRAMRAGGEAYILDQRVAQVMCDQLVKVGWKDIMGYDITVEYLENILRRSSAGEPKGWL
jgi:hypothetical protein